MNGGTDGNVLISKENHERMMKRANQAESEIKHICEENENCTIADRCTTAIDVANIGDLASRKRRYIRGIGLCKPEW